MVVELLIRLVNWANDIGQPKRQEKSSVEVESISAIKVKPKIESNLVSGSTTNNRTNHNVDIGSSAAMSKTMGNMSTSMPYNTGRDQGYLDFDPSILSSGENIRPVDITNRGNKNSTNMPGHRNAPPPQKKKSRTK